MPRRRSPSRRRSRRIGGEDLRQARDARWGPRPVNASRSSSGPSSRAMPPVVSGAWRARPRSRRVAARPSIRRPPDRRRPPPTPPSGRRRERSMAGRRHRSRPRDLRSRRDPPHRPTAGRRPSDSVPGRPHRCHAGDAGEARAPPDATLPNPGRPPGSPRFVQGARRPGPMRHPDADPESLDTARGEEFRRPTGTIDPSCERDAMGATIHVRRGDASVSTLPRWRDAPRRSG